MRPRTLLLGLNAALLLSTSVIAADAISVFEPVLFEEEPLFKLSIDGGVTVFALPDTDDIGRTNIGGGAADEVLFQGVDDLLLGGGLGVSASAPINADGAAINFSAFGAFATRGESDDIVLTDQRLLVLHGPSLPAGTMALDTWDLDGVAVGTIVGDAGDAWSAVTPGGGDAVPPAATSTAVWPDYDVQSGADGFTYAGVAGDWQTFSLGAIATDDGVVFVGLGELAGWEVSKDVTQNVF